jgi:small GTP-binding protein
VITFFKVVMLGLDAAGKTTILYRLHMGEVLSTVPTVGFNVEKVQYKNVVFTVWDVGGQEKLRSLWKMYLSNSDALVITITWKSIFTCLASHYSVWFFCSSNLSQFLLWTLHIVYLQL